MSGKFERVVMNDLTPGLTQFYIDCVMGKYRNRTEWVSRDKFMALKKSDPFIGYIWSFGNNRRTYLYGRDIEDYKRAAHRWVVDNDDSELKAQGLPVPDYAYGDWHERRIAWRNHARKYAKKLMQLQRLQRLQSLQSLQRLQSLQSLQRLQSLQSLQRLTRLQSLQSLQRLTRLQSDYRNVEIEDGAIVYCDPPYKGTNGYDGKGSVSTFDTDAFYNWVRNSPHLVFVSEYAAPSDFRCVMAIKHRKTLDMKKSNNQETVEKLFVHESKADKVGLLKGVL